jgi:hypothetical protein
VTDSPAKIGSEMVKVGNLTTSPTRGWPILIRIFSIFFLRHYKLLDWHKCYVDNPYWLHNRVIFAPWKKYVMKSTFRDRIQSSRDDDPVLSFACV